MLFVAFPKAEGRVGVTPSLLSMVFKTGDTNLSGSSVPYGVKVGVAAGEKRPGPRGSPPKAPPEEKPAAWPGRAGPVLSKEAGGRHAPSNSLTWSAV